MKHNTHIYIASKAIEFCYESLLNLHDSNDNPIVGSVRNKMRRRGNILIKLLKFHQPRVIEASWAPDDILKDMRQFHTFKLFNEQCFDDASNYADQTFTRDGTNYYRGKGSGGLAFKIDHLAKIIKDLLKLRIYNDNFSMEHIMYLFLLLSHYVVDAHVPMHCDIRDDVKSGTRPQNGTYYESKDWHRKLEEKWDKATNYKAHEEKTYGVNAIDPNITRSDLVDSIELTASDIKTYLFDKNKIMNHAIDICIKSYNQSVYLFPPDDFDEIDEVKLAEVTKEIYADAIGNLISIWVCMWEEE